MLKCQYNKGRALNTNTVEMSLAGLKSSICKNGVRFAHQSVLPGCPSLVRGRLEEVVALEGVTRVHFVEYNVRTLVWLSFRKLIL